MPRPFQVIETVNESRATRETEKREGKSLFDIKAKKATRLKLGQSRSLLDRRGNSPKRQALHRAAALAGCSTAGLPAVVARPAR